MLPGNLAAKLRPNKKIYPNRAALLAGVLMCFAGTSMLAFGWMEIS